VHPEALEAGERYLGDEGELGGLMRDAPEDRTSPNPDRRAAYELHAKLRALGAWSAISVHCNKGVTPGVEFVATGGVTTPARLAVANVLGFKSVTVYPEYPFYKLHPEVIETEQVWTDGDDNEKLLCAWESGIETMVGEGPEGMAQIFRERASELQYYQKIGSLPLVKDGVRNDFVWDVLEDLELLVDKVECFAPLKLPQDMMEYLGVGGLELFISSWDSRNESKVVDWAGCSINSGTPRRAFFGGAYVRLDPPVETAPGTLVFNTKTFNLPLGWKSIIQLN
jgi:hypothetical protein